MMWDIEEFEKLFKVHIPKYDIQDYYFDVLSKSKEYENIKVQAETFKAFEESIGAEVTGYKFKCMDRLVDYVKQSKTYEKLQTMIFEPAFTISEIKRTLEVSSDTIFISMDIRSANFTALQSINVENEFEGSWEDLCMKHNVHPVLASSKSFRQMVFGNTNPKRIQKVQHAIMMKVYDNLVSRNMKDKIVFLSHDEIVLKAEDSANASLCEAELNISQPAHIPFKISRYKMERVGKNIFVKTMLDRSYNENYKTLLGCPGNEFYMYFKHFILKEKIEERDLYFWNNDRLAKWVQLPFETGLDWFTSNDTPIVMS